MAAAPRVPTQFYCAAFFRWVSRSRVRICFRSNIAGLPTWYTIRANKDGYVARKKEIDFLVAMNPETASLT
jgi:hypothetical protein